MKAPWIWLAIAAGVGYYMYTRKKKDLVETVSTAISTALATGDRKKLLAELYKQLSVLQTKKTQLMATGASSIALKPVETMIASVNAQIKKLAGA